MRLRKETRIISRKLREFLNDGKVKLCELNVVECGEGIDIKYTPRRLRIFDSISVRIKNHEVWLPIIQRLLLRHAYRKYIARQITKQLAK